MLLQHWLSDEESGQSSTLVVLPKEKMYLTNSLLWSDSFCNVSCLSVKVPWMGFCVQELVWSGWMMLPAQGLKTPSTSASFPAGPKLTVAMSRMPAWPVLSKPSASWSCHSSWDSSTSFFRSENHHSGIKSCRKLNIEQHWCCWVFSEDFQRGERAYPSTQRRLLEDLTL